MPTVNHFISTVLAGRNLATPPDILIAKAKKNKKSVAHSTVLVAVSSPGLP